MIALGVVGALGVIVLAAYDALLTPEEALAAAREAFPPVFARFEFEVRLWAS